MKRAEASQQKTGYSAKLGLMNVLALVGILTNHAENWMLFGLPGDGWSRTCCGTRSILRCSRCCRARWRC